MKKTTDLWFVSFLELNGVKITSYRLLKPGKLEFTFDITDLDWSKMRLDFNNSDIQKYKQKIEALKDLAY